MSVTAAAASDGAFAGAAAAADLILISKSPRQFCRGRSKPAREFNQPPSMTVDHDKIASEAQSSQNTSPIDPGI
jgi:hypothetical protein